MADIGRPRLLVIDDEADIRDFIAEVAQQVGFEPLQAADAETFQQNVSAKQPDLVIMDLAMPGVDGIELLRWLAQSRYPGGVMLMSGADTRVLRTAQRLGNGHGLHMRDYIRKPIPLDALEALLETELRRYRPLA